MLTQSCALLIVGMALRVSNPTVIPPTEGHWLEFANDVARVIYENAPGSLWSSRPVLKENPRSDLKDYSQVFLIEEHYSPPSVDERDDDGDDETNERPDDKLPLGKRHVLDQQIETPALLTELSALVNYRNPAHGKTCSCRACQQLPRGKYKTGLMTSPLLTRLVFGILIKDQLHRVGMVKLSSSTAHEQWPKGWQLYYDGAVRVDDRLVRTMPWMPNAIKIGSHEDLVKKLGPAKAKHVLPYSFHDELFFNPHMSRSNDLAAYEGPVLEDVIFHEVMASGTSELLGYIAEVPVTASGDYAIGGDIAVTTGTRYEDYRYMAYFNADLVRIPILDLQSIEAQKQNSFRGRLYGTANSEWTNRGSRQQPEGGPHIREVEKSVSIPLVPPVREWLPKLRERRLF